MAYTLYREYTLYSNLYLYNNFVFAYHNQEGKIINIKKHKGGQEGEASKKWYLSHKIASYKRDRELFICEGEKDAICLYNEGYQVTSGSCGALSIPNVDELKEQLGTGMMYTSSINSEINSVFDYGFEISGSKMFDFISKKESFPYL